MLNEKNLIIFRGKLLNNSIIDLPQKWESCIDTSSITVCLTPIGAHQNIIIKRISENKVYLQSNSGVPIYCYYHIFGKLRDDVTEKELEQES